MRTAPGQLVIMGDDLGLEVAMARRDGCLAAFIRSGVGGTDPAGLLPEQRPHLEVDSPSELLDLLSG